MSDAPRSPGFSTLAIHAGSNSASFDGLRTMAIDAGVAFVAGDADPATSLPVLKDFVSSDGGIDSHSKNLLEERIATLEGGSAALAVGSGPIARLMALHTLLRPGDEFVASRRLGGGSREQFDQMMPSFGWQVRWVDPDRLDSVKAAVSDRTRAIVVESMGDMGGAVTDVAAVAALAREARVPLIVDNTLATPYLVRPFDHGADVIVHSAMPFLGGPGRAVGGLIVDGGTFDWSGDARFPWISQPCASYGNMVLGDTFGNFAFAMACRISGLRDVGPALSPLNAFLILAGMETLPLRVQRQCDNALAVAQHLVRHPAVHWVRYAGLPSNEGFGLAQRYTPQGAGSILTFGVAGGQGAGARLVRKLKLFSPMGQLGDTRSLAMHPALTPHQMLAGDALIAAGTGQDTVRLSIGLEDEMDLIADLDQALAV